MRAAIALTLSVTIVFLGLASAPPASGATEGADTTISSLVGEISVVADRTEAYNRAYFRHWIDQNGDGCDTRQEVLKAESLVPVTISSGCTITAGQWYSWYDSATWTLPGDVDIDHFVPLAEAWRSGAAGWTAEQREAFANDLAYASTLVAVTDNVNQSKSDKDPAEWLPPAEDASVQCEYVSKWVLVKYRWNLAMDQSERDAVITVLSENGCGSTPATVPAIASTLSIPVSDTGRYTGDDRYDVAINVAAEYAAGVPVLYVAKGTDYPDALSAAPAAAAEGGPLLLTLPTSLPAKVHAEILRLQPAKIVVVGGEASVSAAVYSELSTLSTSITRLGGADRYEASRNIVEYAFGSTGASRVYLATGANFPDALAASAVAGGMNGAVILVNGSASSIDNLTLALISKLAPNDAAIAGGPASVSLGIERSLSTMALPGGSQRFTGVDRYAAAANINEDAFDQADTVYMATGANFPDALTGAVLAGSRHAPLFLVPGSCVTPAVGTAIRSLNPERVVVFGGPKSVSDAAQNLEECASDVNPTPSLTNPGDSVNCSDFSTWQEAQTWFLRYYPLYGDVAKLDGNNDLDACESLPGHP